MKQKIPTRLNGFCFGFALVKSTMVPFFIQGETIEIGGGDEVTPTNGKILSC